MKRNSLCRASGHFPSVMSLFRSPNLHCTNKYRYWECSKQRSCCQMCTCVAISCSLNPASWILQFEALKRAVRISSSWLRFSCWLRIQGTGWREIVTSNNSQVSPIQHLYTPGLFSSWLLLWQIPWCMIDFWETQPDFAIDSGMSWVLG